MHPFYPVPKIQGKQQEEAIRLIEDYLNTHQIDLEYNFNNIENEKNNHSLIVTGSGEAPIATYDNAGIVKPTMQFKILEDGTLSVVIADTTRTGVVMPTSDFITLGTGEMSINRDNLLTQSLLELIKQNLGITQGQVNVIVLNNRDIQSTDLIGLNTLFIKIDKATPTVTSTTTNTSAYAVTGMWYEDAKENLIDIYPTSISLPTTLDIAIDSTSTLVPTFLPLNCNKKQLTWTTSNEDIVTVDNGVVKGVTVGTSDIIAKTINNLKAICRVNVTNTLAIFEDFNDLSKCTSAYYSNVSSIPDVMPTTSPYLFVENSVLRSNANYRTEKAYRYFDKGVVSERIEIIVKLILSNSTNPNYTFVKILEHGSNIYSGHRIQMVQKSKNSAGIAVYANGTDGGEGQFLGEGKTITTSINNVANIKILLNGSTLQVFIDGQLSIELKNRPIKEYHGIFANVYINDVLPSLFGIDSIKVSRVL